MMLSRRHSLEFTIHKRNTVYISSIIYIFFSKDTTTIKQSKAKQSASSQRGRREPKMRTPIFDMVLLCSGDKGEIAVSHLREALQAQISNMNFQQPGEDVEGEEESNNIGQNSQGTGEKNMVDLKALLLHCAKAVAANDRVTANDLLNQIRQHSSPLGDGSQRLAHYFADSLEERLGGRQISSALFPEQRTSTVDILKAYQLHLAACPFKKVSNYFSNQTIMNLAENATSLHIVDFGICYGFQWPTFIQRLSVRPGGPPKLRITGIDHPQTGFKPAERVEETGRRLASYAESFNVPFEFNAIAQNWETIKLGDLNIKQDEVLVVNSLYQFRNLLNQETGVLDSPRNAVLQLVRKMNPNVFIHGIVNGDFSDPFLVTRFQEALFHYSALFDMLETTVPREHPERTLIERDFFGREALNVIACEGADRVERPETYKQWQIRNVRAGFKQLPLNQEIMNKARDRTKEFYHKDFVIDEDSQWLLQGWKGQIIYALSLWTPVHDS